MTKKRTDTHRSFDIVSLTTIGKKKFLFSHFSSIVYFSQVHTDWNQCQDSNIVFRGKKQESDDQRSYPNRKLLSLRQHNNP